MKMASVVQAAAVTKVKMATQIAEATKGISTAESLIVVKKMPGLMLIKSSFFARRGAFIQPV